MPNKIITAEAAVALISNGNTVTTSGFVGIGVPETLLKALELRFQETSTPRDLTLFFAAGQGDGQNKGLNRLGQKGLLSRVIGGHWGLAPKVAKLALQCEIEGYNLPQGVISHQFRDIAAGKPGTLTKVGLGTFVDPRLEGGKINDISHEAVVRLMEIDGEEFLFYPSRRIDVALLRGTSADPAGNITMEREALTIDSLAQAMAAKNSGGVVIVQVEQVVERGSLNPRDVEIPGVLVDAVVVSEPEDHMQTYATPFSHAYSGQYRVPASANSGSDLSIRKIIARRAAFELPINGIVNLGIGMPEGVASVAEEEKLLQHLTLTAEPGVVGGKPASGLDFGAATNTDAIISQNQQFDFYDGGGLDLAVLGMAEVDADGSVNVSRFGSKLAGAGGFINISQNAKAVVFTGTFSSVGLEISVTNGQLKVVQEGKVKKFVKQLEQVTFSGSLASSSAKPVLYITERCVFRLASEGLELIEVAPGIDLDRDILAHMDFDPIICDPARMDAKIFCDEPMELRVDLLHLDLSDRIALDESQQRLFINFEKIRVRRPMDLDLIRARVEEVCGPLTHRVDVIANYDGAQIDQEIEDEYATMVNGLQDRFYDKVTRYSGSAFMRIKLGAVFQRSNAAHIFETSEEAQKYLRRDSEGL